MAIYLGLSKNSTSSKRPVQMPLKVDAVDGVTINPDGCRCANGYAMLARGELFNGDKDIINAIIDAQLYKGDTPLLIWIQDNRQEAYKKITQDYWDRISPGMKDILLKREKTPLV